MIPLSALLIFSFPRRRVSLVFHLTRDPLSFTAFSNRFLFVFSSSNYLSLPLLSLSLSLFLSHRSSASNRTWFPSESRVIHKPINSDNKLGPRVIYSRSFLLFGKHAAESFQQLSSTRFVSSPLKSARHIECYFSISHGLNWFNPLATYGVAEGCALSEWNNRFTRLRGFAMSLFLRSTLD